MVKRPKITIVSGEISGDQYAATLASNIKKLNPEIEITGIGGKKLTSTGIRIIAENKLSGAFGFSSVIKNFRSHLKFFNTCLKAIKNECPDLIVFIDNPGFNLSLAKKLVDFRKIYYIPPKIWAHNYQRIFLIRHLFEAVIVIFPFEKQIYEKENVPAYYFGHPVIDLIPGEISNENFFNEIGSNKDAFIIGIFPGSRQEEIKYILPLLVMAASRVKKIYSEATFVVSCADEQLYSDIKTILEQYGEHWYIWKKSPHVLAKNSKISLCASGTMNLEIALCGTPMIVFYRLSGFNYLIAKLIVKLNYVSPVNIICGKKVVEEFIQNVNWQKFQRVFSQLICESGEVRKKQMAQFKNIRQILGQANVSEKIADFIIKRV